MTKTIDERIAAQIDIEVARDRLAREYWIRAGGNSEGAVEPRTRAELEACARSIVAVQGERAKSVAGRYSVTLHQAELSLLCANEALQEARAAYSRSFDNERALCASKAVELHKLAKRLAELALDAANIAEETP